jgi:hypothetical protein
MMTPHDDEVDVNSRILGSTMTIVPSNAAFAPVWIDFENALIDVGRQRPQDLYFAIHKMLCGTTACIGVMFDHTLTDAIEFISNLAFTRATFTIDAVRAIADAIGSMRCFDRT